jgi:hypothetical protein
VVSTPALANRTPSPHQEVFVTTIHRRTTRERLALAPAALCGILAGATRALVEWILEQFAS